MNICFNISAGANCGTNLTPRLLQPVGQTSVEHRRQDLSGKFITTVFSYFNWDHFKCIALTLFTMNRSVTLDQRIPSTRLTVSTVWEIWWVAHCTSVQFKGRSTWENSNEGGRSPGCVQQPTRGVADGHGQRLDLRQWACLVRVRGVQEVSKDTCKINLTSKWYSRYVAKQGFLDLTAHDYQLVFGVEVKSLLPPSLLLMSHLHQVQTGMDKASRLVFGDSLMTHAMVLTGCHVEGSSVTRPVHNHASLVLRDFLVIELILLLQMEGWKQLGRGQRRERLPSHDIGLVQGWSSICCLHFISICCCCCCWPGMLM